MGIKKNKAQETVIEDVSESKIKFSDAQDFEYVQLDSSIHDQKFKTKPTTFLKDAMKRFVKNKSSVVAASILGVLIMMAIVVPLADQNNIDANNDIATFLPPKWFSNYNGGFMDGTGKVSNVTLDPDNGYYPAADDNGNYKYRKEGVVGEIKRETGYADSPTKVVLKYGQKGTISLTTDEDHTADTYIISNQFSLDLTANYDISFKLNKEYCENEGSYPEYALCIFSDQKAKDGTGIFPITALSTEYETEDHEAFTISNVASVLTSADGYDSSYSFDNASIGFLLKGNTDNLQKTLYISSIDIKKDGAPVTYTDVETSTEVNVGFTDATRGYPSWKNFYSEVKSTVGLYHSEITVGSFTYDYYAAAYCNDEWDFTESDLERFMELGYLEEEYAWYKVLPTSVSKFPGDVKTPAVYYTQEECDAINAQYGLNPGDYGYRTTSDIKEEEVLYASNDLYQIAGEYWVKDTLGVADLVLTEKGKEMCPAEKALSVTVNKFGSFESKSLHCERSRYKYFYYMGYTAKCAKVNYIFGTDAQGHDFFKVVFAGLLTSLELGVLASAINIVIGVVWGAISGYFGGWVDVLMERFCEILGGMPFIVLMTLIVLLFGKSNFWIFLFCLCLTGWMGTAHVTRSQFYRYRGREYVLASRTLGASDWRLIFLHILPNGIGTIVTSAVLMIPGVIFSEASISYLLPGALSFQGATSFGLTLSTAQGFIQLYPYMIVSSSIVMSLIMICFNLFGNGLRDAFNPTTKGAAI